MPLADPKKETQRVIELALKEAARLRLLIRNLERRILVLEDAGRATDNPRERKNES